MADVEDKKTTDEGASQRKSVEELMDTVKKLIDKNGGDTQETILSLVKDNYNLREAKRAMKDKIVPDGAVVLVGDDAKLYQGFKSLGIQPDDINDLAVENQELHTRLIARDVADEMDWKAEVLGDLIGSKGLQLELQEVEEDGKKVKKPFVVETEGGKAKSTLATEHSAIKPYIPSLQREEGEQSTGVRLPKSGPSNSNSKSKSGLNAVAANVLASRYAPRKTEAGK